MVWSKLKKRIEERIASELQLTVDLTVIRPNSGEEGRSKLRFRDKNEILWISEKDFSDSAPGWSEQLEEWLQSPIDLFYLRARDSDSESLEAFLLVIDRRLGKRKLQELRFEKDSPAERIVIRRL